MKTLSHRPTQASSNLNPAASATARVAGHIRRMIGAAQALAQFVSDALRAAHQRRRLHRQLHKQARALAQLDARTLQDIGLHHSEIGSIMAELTERADATRRRTPRTAEDSVAPLY